MKSLSLLVGVCLAVVARAQQFQNLDFELGKTPVGYDSFNATPAQREELLPWWITYYRDRDGIEGSSALPLLNRGNGGCIGSPCIWVGLDSAYHGKFGLDLDAGGRGGSGGETGVRQKGQLPANARSLKLSASGGTVRVRIDGNQLTSFVEAGAIKGVLMSFDVSGFAGRFVELTVATGSWVQVDNIGLSTSPPTPVPPTIKFSGPLSDGRIVIDWSGHLQQATAPAGPFMDVGAAVNGSRDVWLFEPFQKQSNLFFRARN